MSDVNKTSDETNEEEKTKSCDRQEKMAAPNTSLNKKPISKTKSRQQRTINDFFIQPKKKQRLDKEEDFIPFEGEAAASSSRPDGFVCQPSRHDVLMPSIVKELVPVTALSTVSELPGAVPVPGPSSAFVSSPVLDQEAPKYYDIGNHIGKKIDDFTIMNLLENHWIPSNNYDFPFSSRNYCEKVVKNFVRASHLENYKDWLVLSDSKKGLFCKYCPLFTTRSEGGFCKNIPLKTLVTEPLKNFKKLNGNHGDLESHCNTKYHKSAVMAGKDFLKRYHSPQLEICNVISSERLEQVKENRAKLTPIVKTIILLGRQNIPLRGHRDDGPLSDPSTTHAENEGNFKALLKFRIDSGDQVLKKHLESMSSRATYLSKTTQNLIIECCRQEILEQILSRVKKAEIYSIIFDETTDSSHKSQISLVLRYVFFHQNGEIQIREDFLTFIDAFQSMPVSEYNEDDKDEHEAAELSLTGENLGRIILKKIQELHLPIEKCIGITTDGCSVMMSSDRGAVHEIQKEVKNAIITPCYSHKLNNSISKSSKVAVIENSVSVMKEVISFFSYPKRDMALKQFLGKKLVNLCETRWTERHDGVVQFTVTLPDIVHALEKISQWKAPQTAGKASILVKAVIDTQFIIGLFCLSDVLSLTLPLSLILQKENLDVARASEVVRNLLKTLQDQRKEAEEHFHEVFVKCEKMAETLGLELTKPRVCGRQTKRDNYQVASVEVFYRLSTYIPLLENIIEDMRERFSPEMMDVLNLPLILPDSVTKTENILKLNNTLKSVIDRFENVLDGLKETNYFRLKAELCHWQNHWRAKEERGEKLPTKALQVFRECDKDVFPVLNNLLKILCTLPVSNASSERSFSTLRLIKTYLRSTMSENRLIGLALLNIHKDIHVDPEKVIDRFSKSGNHRFIL